MDKKDEIILQQLDVIRTMTQNNLNRMGSDFWGAPLTPDAPSVRARKKRKKRRFPHPRRSRTSKKSLTPTSALARSSAR